jgi:hypothetical protein
MILTLECTAPEERMSGVGVGENIEVGEQRPEEDVHQHCDHASVTFRWEFENWQRRRAKQSG